MDSAVAATAADADAPRRCAALPDEIWAEVVRLARTSRCAALYIYSPCAFPFWGGPPTAHAHSSSSPFPPRGGLPDSQIGMPLSRPIDIPLS